MSHTPEQNPPPASAPISLRHRLEKRLLDLLGLPLRRCARHRALAIGRRLGRLAGRLQPKRIAIARENLRQAFPDLPGPEVERIIRELFEHVGASMVDLLRQDLLDPDNDLHRLYRFEGLEHLRAAYAEGRGALLLTGHVGYWEGGTFFLPLLGFPVDFIAKPMKNPLTDAQITAMRTHWGGGVINSRQGARRIVRSLRDGRGVAVLLDQRISPREGVPVQFFGRTAFTTPIITQIAKKNRVPIVPMFCYRQPDDRYLVVAEPAIRLDDDLSSEAIQQDTQHLTDILEQAIRREKSQWFWMHRRWRD